LLEGLLGAQGLGQAIEVGLFQQSLLDLRCGFPLLRLCLGCRQSTSQVSCQSPALRRSACKGARILLLLDVCCARLMTVPAPCCWP
ncbi:hypothetical protein, partial [Pseudomonas bubulae]|uniref:hypothetical protein n=1 Tax=Pseudomonas bubulae TaxID=2316085 RepID=UPI001C4F7D92